MLRDGVDPSSPEWSDVAYGLNRELKLPPWSELVLDLEAFAVDPEKLESTNWRFRVSSIGSWRRPIAAGALIKESGMVRCLFNVRFPA